MKTIQLYVTKETFSKNKCYRKVNKFVPSKTGHRVTNKQKKSFGA